MERKLTKKHGGMEKKKKENTITIKLCYFYKTNICLCVVSFRALNYAYNLLIDRKSDKID